MKFLVTGGAGFIGSNLVKGLNARGIDDIIAVDDLNHWVGHLGRNKQTKTPNIDRLAAMGVTFANAQCAAPVCNPSRVGDSLATQVAGLGTLRARPSSASAPLPASLDNRPLSVWATQARERGLSVSSSRRANNEGRLRFCWYCD